MINYLQPYFACNYCKGLTQVLNDNNETDMTKTIELIKDHHTTCTADEPKQDDRLTYDY
jgi:hypothetical protein